MGTVITYGMVSSSAVLSVLVLSLLLLNRGTTHAGPITFSNGGYDGVVVSIADNVPAYDCKNILDKLEVSSIPRNTCLISFRVVLLG
jgi:hypothetical protein